MRERALTKPAYRVQSRAILLHSLTQRLEFEQADCVGLALVLCLACLCL